MRLDLKQEDVMRARTILVASLVLGLGILLGASDRDQAVSSDERGQTPRAMIGVIGNMVFLVQRVEPGSPAEQAGLRPDDLIMRINGRPVNSVEDLREITQSPPGRPIEVVFLRYDPATQQYKGYHTTLTSAPWRAPSP
jgi:S1-C subfamily serine protease